MKRALDIVGAVLALVLLFPIMLMIGALVRLSMGSPMLFRQTRPGRGGRPFVMFKFRTMRQATDAAGNPLPDADRITWFGRLLRRSSLDELPELWNVLRGDMSFVGPRPLLVEYLPLYTSTQARRHEVRPGITGWAQVNGRNAISWEDKFDLDVWYVDHQSLILDLLIMATTVYRVFRGEGVTEQGSVSVTPFRGSLPSARD